MQTRCGGWVGDTRHKAQGTRHKTQDTSAVLDPHFSWPDIVEWSRQAVLGRAMAWEAGSAARDLSQAARHDGQLDDGHTIMGDGVTR